MSGWDAGRYLQFADARTQPAIDLAARVALESPLRIVDIGCGPGNSTAVLRRCWPGAQVTGLDNSPEMLAAARKDAPAETWLLADAAAWQPDAPFDLVFSNAALQWLPDHALIIPRLFAMAAPGGAFAFQIPARTYSRIHELLLQIADAPEWTERMQAAKRNFTLTSPGFYYDLLAGQASHLDIWETEYCHVMADHAAIVEWVSGTALRPFLDALVDESERQRFIERFATGVAAAYPPQADGKIMFPFSRLSVLAYRPG